MTIENHTNISNTVLIMLSMGTPATNTSFTAIKRYNVTTAATTNNFCWLAIGESSEITSGNVPFCKSDTGVQILTGYDNVAHQTDTINFNTSYPFSSAPKVFMSLITANAYIFSIELKGQPTTTSFSYCKHASNTGAASGEAFYWLAIGNRSASGNVPVCPLLSGPKILYGKDTRNLATGTVTFTAQFSQIPVVILSITDNNSNNYVYGITTTSVTINSFNFSKRYWTNLQASSEYFWWMAIGV